MAITTTLESVRRVALASIHVPDNVRALDDEHVKALAGSIALQGMLVPVVVRTDGDRFDLVAGFHRVAAARSLARRGSHRGPRRGHLGCRPRRGEHRSEGVEPVRGGQGGPCDA